jgi:hypothetical protein
MSSSNPPPSQASFYDNQSCKVVQHGNVWRNDPSSCGYYEIYFVHLHKVDKVLMPTTATYRWSCSTTAMEQGSSHQLQCLLEYIFYFVFESSYILYFFKWYILNFLWWGQSGQIGLERGQADWYGEEGGRPSRMGERDVGRARVVDFARGGKVDF